MRGLMLLIGGIVIGIVIGTTTSAPLAQGAQPNVRLNHVAISVPNINEALVWNSGGRIELSYQPAEGRLRKASDDWK